MLILSVGMSATLGSTLQEGSFPHTFAYTGFEAKQLEGVRGRGRV